MQVFMVVCINFYIHTVCRVYVYFNDVCMYVCMYVWWA